MRILIATPLTQKQVGGPAQYAYQLERVFKSMGHEVRSVAFSTVAGYPPGIRHILLFFRILFLLRKSDAVIVLDTVSMALPVVCAAFVMRVPSFVRVGGDFLWERYVERTQSNVILSEFYTSRPKLSFKEKCIFWVQKNVVLQYATKIIFSTAWQLDIWKNPYAILSEKVVIIENAYRLHDAYREEPQPQIEPYVITWIGRSLVLKNLKMLQEAVREIQKKFPQVQLQTYEALSHEETMKVLRSSWLVAIPSLSEVSPNVAMESISLGAPVLLTKDCGLKDVLSTVAVWIDSRNMASIIKALEELMDPEVYTTIRNRTADFNTERTYEVVGEEYIQKLHIV